MGKHHITTAGESFFLMFIRLTGESLPDRGWGYRGAHHAQPEEV
ncbi:hypothetical protein [Corynebacterium macginleyi]|nr:hypothetical protein [Corynebacterium macginleyi]